jgi:flagellar motor switch protein FliN/FliY
MSDENEQEDQPESGGVDYQDLSSESQNAIPDDEGESDEIHTAGDLEAVFDVPVNVSAVLGKSYLQVSQLLKLGPGAVIELDRKVGEAIDIYVNNRLVARGEVVLVEERLGITMTEIIKGDGR